MKYNDWKIKLCYPDELLSSIIKERKIKEPELFLNPDYRDISDHKKLLNIDQSTKRIEESIEQKKKIGLFCDYDADGVCGGAIIYRAVKSLGGNIIEYVPKRSEGYGLSDQAVEFFIKQNIDLLITVDCGIKNIKEISKLKSNGIDSVVIDHHIIDKEMPDAIVIHPALTTDNTNLELSGGGTAYMQARELLKESGKEKWLIDLAAISSVADVVPLNNDNRIIVKYGLTVLKKTKNNGLKELLKISGLQDRELGVYDLGFGIAPRLNAAGRIAHPIDSFNLLAKDDIDFTAIADRLNDLNLKRQEMLLKAIEEASKKIIDENKEREKIIVIKGPWDEGIVGLIASKICEKYYRPVIVLSESKELLKGSARSIEKINITSIISKAEDILTSFGGHAQAAGLSLKPAEYKKLEKILHQESVKLEDELFKRSLVIDALVKMDQITLDTAQELERLAPFGQGNPRPVLALKNVKIAGYELIGKDKSHLKLHFELDGIKSSCLLFSFCSRGYEPKEEGFIDIAFSLGINEFRGTRKVDLIIEDVQESK
jgi:single-stranded-DNA-specific exonuclease